jgi:hypothetical protein
VTKNSRGGLATLNAEIYTLPVEVQIIATACYVVTVFILLFRFRKTKNYKNIIAAASVPIAVFFLCFYSLPCWLPTQETENWLTSLIFEGLSAIVFLSLARSQHSWVAKEFLASVLSTFLIVAAIQIEYKMSSLLDYPSPDLRLFSSLVLLGFFALYLKLRAKEIGYLQVVEIPESYTNQDRKDANVWHKRDYHTLVNAEARGVIQSMHSRRKDFSLAVKFEGGVGKVFLLSEGGEGEVDVLGASFRSHVPGLITEKVAGLSLRVPYVAIAYLKKKARPIVDDPLGIALEHFAQNELHGILMVYARPLSSLGEMFSRFWKKGKLNRGWRKPIRLRSYDEREEQRRTWEIVEESNIKMGVYAAVFAGTDEEARQKAEVLSGVLAAGVEPPDVKVVSGRGGFRLLVKMLSLECEAPMDLLRVEASTFLQIPKRDIGTKITKTSIFAQTAYPEPEVGSQGILLGNLMRNGTVLRRKVYLLLKDLKSHLLAIGLTGMGKTNLIKAICKALKEAAVSFVVFDPIKQEYRDLMLLLGGNVFTVGDESNCNIRYNPLIFPECVHVETHISNLVDVFRYAFVLWPPLPEILKMGLRMAYEAKGWDVTGNIPGGTPDLRDVYRATDALIEASPYEAKFKADMRGALTTRLGSLTLGGMGHMFLCGKNVPSIDDILETPTTFELHSIGRDDKPLITALLVNYLYENMRCKGRSRNLRLMVFVDEAHRVVGEETQDTGSEIASRGIILTSKLMSEVLSEARAYGMGLTLSDQFPGRLMEDAIKNTKTKVIFHLPDEADRELMGRSIGLTVEQIRAMLGLSEGYAVYSVVGKDPMQVKTINLEELFPTDKQVDDIELVKHMQNFYQAHPLEHNPQVDVHPTTLYQLEQKKAKKHKEQVVELIPLDPLEDQMVLDVALWAVKEEKLAETYNMLQKISDGNPEGYLREVAEKISKYFPQPVERIVDALRIAIEEEGGEKKNE